MVRMQHKITDQAVAEGMHLYVYRKGGLYAHHGLTLRVADVQNDELLIAISAVNRVKNLLPPLTLDAAASSSFIVLEQSKQGLQFVTLEEFKAGSPLRQVLYGVSKLEAKCKRAGTCHTNIAPLAHEITQNALSIMRTEHKEWNKYDVVSRSCETLCVRATGAPTKNGLQADSVFNRIEDACVLFISMLPPIGSSAPQGIFAKLLQTFSTAAPELATTSSTQITWASFSSVALMSVSANGIACAVGFCMEAALLTARLCIHLLEERYTFCGAILQFAITPQEYLHGLIIAGCSHGFGFFGSVLGSMLGLIFPHPAVFALGSLAGSLLFNLIGRALADKPVEWLLDQCCKLFGEPPKALSIDVDLAASDADNDSGEGDSLCIE